MKRCLKCGQTYTDDSLNFCLNDGEMLVQATGFEPPPTQYADDSPPTIMMDQPRVTNPIDWAASGPPEWRGQSQPVPAPQFGMAGYGAPRDQNFPTISLVLGIIACLGVCCFGGFWAGLPAVIFGYLALRNIESRPDKYTGRGMAIAGMVIGIITFFASFLFLIIGRLS